MRKWFDKYIAQSYKWQLGAMGAAFLAIILVGALIGMAVLSPRSDSMTVFGHNWLWGIMMCVDGGFVSETLGASTQMDGGAVVQYAPWWVITLSLIYWFLGLVLVAFFTGAVTNFLDSRREKILVGDVDYAFSGNYVLVVGYDFQVKNLLRTIMGSAEHKGRDIVLVTDTSVEEIHEDILPELNSSETRRLFVMRKDIALAETYSNFTITGAAGIFVIGDGGVVGRDGKTLQAIDEITKKAKSEKPPKGLKPIKVYLHIEDSVLYTQIRSIVLPPDECPFFNLDVYNYYESWAWECWSRKDAKDYDGTAYLPLRHRTGTDRVELFVIGAGRMGRAMVNFALPLLNYGETGKKCRVTIFDADPLKKGFLPDKVTLEALPESEVCYLPIDGCSDEANEIMLDAARRADTSVTVVIALSDPGAAIRAYSEISNRMRRCPVSVLVWQATHSKNCPAKKFLRMGGLGSNADKTELRYFGMTDILPWQNTARFEYGEAIGYYYDQYVEWAKPRSRVRSNLPCAADPSFPAHAKGIWKADVARESWRGKERWKKWSSINSGDTFREKSLLFDKSDYPASANRILRAEHNRWWTERLLAGWVYSPERDDNQLEHWDMVDFDRLHDSTKEIDKINIAAMAHFGFV